MDEMKICRRVVCKINAFYEVKKFVQFSVEHDILLSTENKVGSTPKDSDATLACIM